MRFNTLLINCRSLKPKLESLIENFKHNESNVAMLTETWFYKSDSQLKNRLLEIKNRDSVCLIRKDRDSRGGGVAVAFVESKCSFTKLALNSLKRQNLKL